MASEIVKTKRIRKRGQKRRQVHKAKQPARLGQQSKTTIDPEIAAAERARPTNELGVTGLLSFAGQIEEAYLSELRYPAAYAKYNEMLRRDPTIASLTNAINMLARTASWEVEQAGSSDVDKRAAEFLEQCVQDMSIVIEDSVEDMLSAIPFGWAWSEIVYKRRKGPGADPESKYDDDAVGWRKFAPRRQSSFYKWEWDENGGVRGLHQAVAADTKSTRYMPINKSLHFVSQRDMGNPEGRPLLESVYESWHFVKNLQIINGIGFERSFVGLPKFTYGTPENPYTPTAEDKALVSKTGKGLRVDEKAFVAVPGQIGFDLLSTTNEGAASILETIKHYRINMLQVALADFIALGTTASGGSYSLGQDKSSLFLMAIDGWLDKLAHPDKLGIFNRYAVPRLFSYNSFDGITDYPRLKHSSVQKPDLTALATYLQSLAAYIHPDAMLEADLRKKGNLPPLDKTSETPEVESPDGDQAVDEQADSDAGPETGDQENDGSAGDAAAMSESDPHPPARGQRWFQMRFEKLEHEFENAMKGNGST